MIAFSVLSMDYDEGAQPVLSNLVLNPNPRIPGDRQFNSAALLQYY